MLSLMPQEIKDANSTVGFRDFNKDEQKEIENKYKTPERARKTKRAEQERERAALQEAALQEAAAKEDEVIATSDEVNDSPNFPTVTGTSHFGNDDPIMDNGYQPQLAFQQSSVHDEDMPSQQIIPPMATNHTRKRRCVLPELDESEANATIDFSTSKRRRVQSNPTEEAGQTMPGRIYLDSRSRIPQKRRSLLSSRRHLETRSFRQSFQCSNTIAVNDFKAQHVNGEYATTHPPLETLDDFGSINGENHITTVPYSQDDHTKDLRQPNTTALMYDNANTSVCYHQDYNQNVFQPEMTPLMHGNMNSNPIHYLNDLAPTSVKAIDEEVLAGLGTSPIQDYSNGGPVSQPVDENFVHAEAHTELHSSSALDGRRFTNPYTVQLHLGSALDQACATVAENSYNITTSGSQQTNSPTFQKNLIKRKRVVDDNDQRISSISVQRAIKRTKIQQQISAEESEIFDSFINYPEEEAPLAGINGEVLTDLPHHAPEAVPSPSSGNTPVPSLTLDKFNTEISGSPNNNTDPSIPNSLNQSPASANLFHNHFEDGHFYSWFQSGEEGFANFDLDEVLDS